MTISAINPLSGEIELAWLIFDHFGPNRHAVLFKSTGPNGPRFSADEIPWEPVNNR